MLFSKVIAFPAPPDRFRVWDSKNGHYVLTDRRWEGLHPYTLFIGVAVQRRLGVVALRRFSIGETD